MKIAFTRRDPPQPNPLRLGGEGAQGNGPSLFLTRLRPAAGGDFEGSPTLSRTIEGWGARYFHASRVPTPGMRGVNTKIKNEFGVRIFVLIHKGGSL